MASRSMHLRDLDPKALGLVENAGNEKSVTSLTIGDLL